MGKYVIDEATLTAIGDSIRQKEETAEDVPVMQMAERISAIQDARLEQILRRNVTVFEDDRITKLGKGAFYYCESLESVNFPNVTDVLNKAFEMCISLKTVELPKATELYMNAFQACAALQDVCFPSVITIGSGVFQSCSSLRTVKFEADVRSLGSGVFQSCKALEWVDFTACTAVPILSGNFAGSSSATNVPDTCEIRVPAALVEEWKAASKWSNVASRIVGV